MRAGSLLAIIVAALGGTPAGAYYHYVHFLSRNAPFTPLQERFDPNALPNKTVSVFVSDTGPTAYAPNDSFASVLSQVRQAALAWNSVDSSDLRVSFGGLIQNNSSPNTPGVKVIFDEVPPGLYAFTVHTAASAPAAGSNGLFFPIQQSIVKFRRDVSVPPGPSYLDSFYTTAVHELGHALGLQHTFTSSAMTVAVNRNMNRSRPLEADDIAGLSLLYPKAGYQANVGAISGRVTANGQGVNLASVVALRPAGAAISAMTNPDGTYRIDGLPPDNYYVYVHPIPPDHNITSPVDNNSRAFDPSGAFDTVFYPGTRDFSQFRPIGISAGNTASGIDFAVRPRSSALIYDGSTYIYIGQNLVQPAVLNSAANTQATFGFGAQPSVSLPVSAQVLGVDPNVRMQSLSSQYLALFPQWPLGVAPGPRHLILNFGSDLYVLPSAMTLVQKQPPSIQSVAQLGDGSVAVAGSNMGPDTRVFFDGLPATVRLPFSGNDANGTVVVTPPTGFSGQHATVSVFNADGQTSQMVQAQNPPVYSYPNTDSPQISASPASLPAGTSAMVDIVGVNTNFVNGQVTVGFGTNDVIVRRLWVLSANHLQANVTVLPNANVDSTEISVIAGFQTMFLPFSFQTQPPNPRVPTIALPLVNANPGQANLYAGATVQAFGSNLAQSPNSASATLTDANGTTYPVQISYASANQINFVVPSNIPTGVAMLRVNNGTDTAFAVAVQIDAQPPVIASVTSTSNSVLDAAHPATTGDVLTLTVGGLDKNVDPSRLRVTVSGIDLPVVQVQPGQGNNPTQVMAVVTQAFGGQQVPVSIAQDGTFSNPVLITIR